MVNSKEFAVRLERILAYYDLSASAFARAIGIQPSGISHLVSGRNKPSLDFVMKVCAVYNEVSLEWLLYGNGTFPKTANTALGKPEKNTPRQRSEVKADPKINLPVAALPSPSIDQKNSDRKKVDKIIICYSDGTFEFLKQSE